MIFRDFEYLHAMVGQAYRTDVQGSHTQLGRLKMTTVGLLRHRLSSLTASSLHL